MSARLQQATTSGCLVVAGPSGVGKSTLISRALEANPGWRFSVSVTTRAPREGEENGVNYHYASEGEFLRRVSAGDFVEYAEVYGNYYGTLKSEIDSAGTGDKRVLIEVDTVGSLTIHSQRPEIPLVAVLPPSVAELHRRLKARHSESPESLRRRLASVNLELSRLRSFDYAIVNDDIDRAVEQLLEVMRVVEHGLPFVQAKVDSLLCEFKEVWNEA